MDATKVEEIKKEIRGYYLIFAGLVSLSLVTVGIYYLHLPLGFAVFCALLIAALQVFLAAGYFMHLISEKMIILYGVLALTACFAIAELALPSIEHHNPITGTIHHQEKHHEPVSETETHHVP